MKSKYTWPTAIHKPLLRYVRVSSPRLWMMEVGASRMNAYLEKRTVKLLRTKINELNHLMNADFTNTHIISDNDIFRLTFSHGPLANSTLGGALWCGKECWLDERGIFQLAFLPFCPLLETKRGPTAIASTMPWRPSCVILTIVSLHSHSNTILSPLKDKPIDHG